MSAAPTLLEALNRWTRAVPRSPRTVANYRYALSRLAASGIKTLADVTARKLSRHVERRGGGAVVHQEIAALSSLTRYLVACGEAPRETLHTVRDLRPAVRRPRPLHARFLTREQFERLRTAARSMARYRRGPPPELALVIGALSGLRAGELARLRWDAIDLEKRVIAVRFDPSLGWRGSIKTGRERLTPICSELHDYLAPLKARATGAYVFETGPRATVNKVCTPGYLHYQLKRTARRAGVEGVSLVILRHTRASWWVAAGVPIAKCAFWLGHSVEMCSRHYVGLLAGYDADCERGEAFRVLRRAAK